MADTIRGLHDNFKIRPTGISSDLPWYFDFSEAHQCVMLHNIKGALNMQDQKMQDMKLADQTAGHEIEGPICKTRKCRTRKCKTWNCKIAGYDAKFVQLAVDPELLCMGQ